MEGIQLALLKHTNCFPVETTAYANQSQPTVKHWDAEENTRGTSSLAVQMALLVTGVLLHSWSKANISQITCQLPSEKLSSFLQEKGSLQGNLSLTLV